MTESGIHHFATQAKIASISEQNVMIVSVCFLSWRIGVKREQKEAVSRLQKDFPACGPVQHQYVFSKGLLGEFCQLQLFPAEIYLFVRH